ncbi:hypothetical protein BH24GEM3_BH24GEM3_09430 [soil metagenome]|jgi:hypothetical protein|nr:hypothetical protein [Gemmatimonadota bacterium]
MSPSRRAKGLLLILALVVAAQLGRALYRWFEFGEERAQLTALREQVVDAGVEVLRTQARADTLRGRIREEDEALETRRRTIERYSSYARNGGLSAQLYGAYRAELEQFNARVRERNRRADEWAEVVARNQEAVRRYNLLADSIRALAASIGDPYYPVPLPVEAAAERGIIPAP